MSHGVSYAAHVGQHSAAPPAGAYVDYIRAVPEEPMNGRVAEAHPTYPDDITGWTWAQHPGSTGQICQAKDLGLGWLAGSLYEYVLAPDLGSTDMWIESVLRGLAGFAKAQRGLCVRVDAGGDPRNSYSVELGGTGALGLRLKKYRGQEWPDERLIEIQGFPSGITRLEVVGNTFKLWADYPDTDPAVYGEATDSEWTTGTRCGVWGRAAGAEDAMWSHFRCGAL